MVSQTELIDVPPWRPEHFIGGHPALDLVNTVSHRRDPMFEIDRLDSANKIASWCDYQGLLTDQESRVLIRKCGVCKAESALVNSISDLRNAAGEIFDSIVAYDLIPSTALTRVLSMSSDSRVALLSIPKSYHEACKVSVSDVANKSVIALLAVLVIDGMFRLPRERVRSCPRCGWVFCDGSKGGRRKWCSMKACGNREKVSRHYRTQQP